LFAELLFFFLFTKKTCAISITQKISKEGKCTIEAYIKVLMKHSILYSQLYYEWQWNCPGW